MSDEKQQIANAIKSLTDNVGYIVEKLLSEILYLEGKIEDLETELSSSKEEIAKLKSQLSDAIAGKEISNG